MSNVLIDRQKIDILANAISDKSGVPVTMTLDEMLEAVDGIETGGGEPNLQAKTYTVDSAGTATVTADSGYDGLSSVAVSVPEAEPYVYKVSQYVTQNNSRKWQVRAICDIDDEGEDHSGYIGLGSYSSSWYTYTAVPANTTVTPTESSQTIGGANYMMEGAVTVNAIPSNYVGSGIVRRDHDDLYGVYDDGVYQIGGPAGYYQYSFYKTVPTGTEGTPTATKGSVSNHQVSVTPSVTNTAGYITGSTKNGTAVTVSASELVSGTYTVDSSGTKDVTNYASASVTAGTAGTPSASKGAVSNHSVSVTPSVTNTTGWITGSTKTGTAVTVSASELVSGTYTVSASGTHDVTNYSSASVASGSATASAAKGTVSNHSVTVTPSVTRTAGYITAGSANGTAVTVTASELVSGSETKTENGTYNVTNLASLVVNIPFVTYYTGTSTPSSSLGSNGDIYLMTV